ncbi:hypothetical protein GOP47_0028737 [Adiantum capillus-veneris]|nr:hypothetical protein GOP47_0028737 [Adiantum capillus-veneris]
MSKAGLFSWESSGLRALPLQRVGVAASVYDLCTEVKVTQVYFNARTSLRSNPSVTLCSASESYGDVDAGTECVFLFPLDEESAVFSFTCELDGHTLHAEIQERAKARATYSHAVRSNMSAMLLEQQAENIFTCCVGRLRRGSTCVVTITYLTLLEQEGRFNRLTVPLSIAPKYTPPTHNQKPFLDPFWNNPVAPQFYVHNGHGCDSCLTTPIIGPRFHCMQCPDYDLCSTCYKTKSHDHAMQEITGGLSSSMSVDVPAMPLPMESMEGKLEDLTIDVSVQMPSRILSMKCTSHPQDTHIQQQTETRGTAHYFSKTQYFLSKDFVIIIEQEACFDPRVLCELDVANHTAAISLAFIPRPFDLMAVSQLQCELIFVLDCSGSMQGESISCVAQCMRLLLHSLPVNCIFNIIRFGSTWSSLFPSSSQYDNASLHAASQCFAGLSADLGGTEMYAPLEYALCSDLHTTHPRQIFLLTDAQVSNVDSLLGLVSKHGTNSRVFTVGIGNCPDRSLCKRIAQAGNGKCEFVSAKDSAGGAMRDKVMRQLGRALQPSLTEVKVDWKTVADISTDLQRMSIDEEKATSSGQSIVDPVFPSRFLQCPSVAPAIFINSRFVLHALNVHLPDMVWDQTDKDIHIREEINVNAKANHLQESVTFQRSVALTGQQLTRATVIHTLAARARIRELEELVLRETDGNTKGKLEEEILTLSLRYSLVSSMASFVAVYDNGDVKPDALQMEGWDLSRYDVAWSPSLFGSSVHNSLAYSPWLPTSSSSVRNSFAYSPWSPTSISSVHNSFGYSPCSSTSSSSVHECFEHTSFGSSPDTLFGSTCAPTQFGLSMPSSLNTSGSSFPCSSDARVQFGVSGSALTPSGCGPLEGLVQLQSANGTWDITPQLVNILCGGTSLSSLTVESLKVVCVKHSVSEKVVASLAVLLFLNEHCKEREHEWQLLASKSQFYLANMANISESLQAMIIQDIMLLGS